MPFAELVNESQPLSPIPVLGSQSDHDMSLSQSSIAAAAALDLGDNFMSDTGGQATPISVEAKRGRKRNETQRWRTAVSESPPPGQHSADTVSAATAQEIAIKAADHAVRDYAEKSHERMQKAMSDFMAQLSAGSQEDVRTTVANATLRTEATFDGHVREINERITAQDERVSAIAAAVEHNRADTAELRSRVAASDLAIAALQRELVVLRAPDPVFDPLSIDHHRDINPGLLRLRTIDEAPIEAVRITIDQLLARAGYNPTDAELAGPQLGRQFMLSFAGEPQLAARKAARTQAMQKKPDGSWEKLSVKLPGAGQAITTLFVDRDKNPAQILCERATKHLRDLCQEVLPHAGKFFAKRADHQVSIDWVPVAKIESPAPGKVEIRWNVAARHTAALQASGLQERLSTAVGPRHAEAQWV